MRITILFQKHANFHLVCTEGGAITVKTMQLYYMIQLM